jgi:hypothetical protein
MRLLGWVVLLAGCNNPCQTMCEQMADLSRECGNDVSDAEVDDCVEAFSTASKDDKQTCDGFNQPDAIRREWTCEDVNLFRE